MGGNLRRSEKEGNRQIEGRKKICDENERRGKEISGERERVGGGK